MAIYIDMGFELTIKSEPRADGTNIDYVRWKDKDGLMYAGLAYSYKSLLSRDIDDIPEAQLSAEESRSRTRSRYFFVLESVLMQDQPPKELILWSDKYKISFDRTQDVAVLFREFKEDGLTMLLRAFNQCSSNPFGRYDNSPNDAKRYFIFNNTSELNIARNFLQSSDLPLLLTPYTLVDTDGYYQIDPTTRGNLKICGLNMQFSTEINQNAMVSNVFPSATTIQNVQNANFNTPQFIQPTNKKLIRTTATIATLTTASVLGREISQKAVMNNKSANNIAWQLGLQGQSDDNYEWLHMSAFSFGTPMDLDTAQSIDNLILGTSAANSQMLLFETQIHNILRMQNGEKIAYITVIADCATLNNGEYATWLAHSITYNVSIIDTNQDDVGSAPITGKRTLKSFLKDIFPSFEVVFDPFQIISPTVVEQQIVRGLIKEIRDDYNAKKHRTNDDSTIITALSPSLQRLLVRRPSKPVPHQIESVNVNLFGRTNVPAIRETRHQLRLTTVDTPYLVPGDQPFSFAQLFGGVLSSASWLLFDNAQFTVRDDGEQFFLEFDGDLRMDTGNPLLAAFKDLLGAGATLAVGGGLLLKNEITSWEDLETITDPSYIDLGAAATFTRPLIPHPESTEPVNSSIVLTNLGLEVTIFRKINLMNLGEGINALNLPQDWATWVFLSGAVEFHNLNSPEPVVLQAEFQYTSENIMVNASVSGVQNLFGLEALSFDYLGAQFVYGQDPEVALRAIYTPFAKSFEFGGIMSSAGVGIYCNAEEFDLNDINDIFNNLTGADLHLPDWDMTFENVRISLATADGLVIGPETLNQGLFISATVRIRDYAASVIGEFTPNGVYFEGLVTEMVENPLLAEGMTLNSLRLIIDLNKTASDFMFSGEMSYSGLTLDCSVHVEKAGETWNETLYAELHGPSFGLSTLFPSAANSILDTLRFSDAAIIISNYDGTYYKGDTLYDVTHGVHLKCTLEEIPFISALIHSRQIGLQLSAELGGAINRLGIAMPQSTALQLGNAVRCEPFSIYAYLTPTPNLILDFGFSLINIPNQDPLRFDLTLDVGVAEAEAAATMTGTIQNFMGITGLNVADLGLEVGIIYEQFAVSGIPSELALTAKLQDIDIQAAFALKISENPDEEIMYLHVGDVSVNTLVNMIETFIPQIGAVQAPNFLTIHDMTLYCAPMGGQIGVLKFEPGMNFSASMILGDTSVDIMAYFSKNGYTDASGMVHAPGLYAAGKVERFNLGPLTVTGMEGQDAEVQLFIEGRQSRLHVDCAIEFYGMLCGAYLDIGNDHVTFEAKLVLTDILFIDLVGNGHFTNGRLTDFQVNGVLHNNFNNYLANLVINKLNQGFAYLDHAIDALQNKVDEADEALNNALDAVNAALAEKEAEVQNYLHSCQDNLVAAQDHMDHAIQNAMKDVEKKKADFDQVLYNAKQDVQNAQNAFDAKMREAEATLENKRREFDAGMINAQKDLDKAQGKWDAIVGNAVAAVTAARNKVDGLSRDIAEAQKQVDDSHWYSKGYYEAKRDAIIAAKGIADGILNTAIRVLNGIMNSTDNIFTQAQAIFNTTRNGLDSAVRGAETLLDNVRQGTEYIALQQAQNALSIIETGADYTVWKAAEKVLEEVRKVEQDLVDAAQYAIDNIAETAVYHAFKLAEDTVSAVQNGPLATAYNAATSALTAASKDVDKMKRFADDLVAAGLEAFYINLITVEAMYSSAKTGLFNCEVSLQVLDRQNTIHMTLDLDKMEDFAQQVYALIIGQVDELYN